MFPSPHSAHSLGQPLPQQQIRQSQSSIVPRTARSELIKKGPARDWCPTQLDATIPTIDIQRQEWVLKLVNAINNTTNVYDKRSNAFKKHWEAPYYSAADKEMVAWDILDLVEPLHRTGPTVLTSFDKNFWAKANVTRDWTFEHRMNKIVELLTCSKARCEKMLANKGFQVVVANSEILLTTTAGNSVHNGKRQITLEKGRAVRDKKRTLEQFQAE
jgi:hypothetical protein